METVHTPEEDSSSAKTRWHRLFGSVLEQLLAPVGILVQTAGPVMSDPPEADILLLRRDTPTWTQEQLAQLPDGIRHSQASHILIEFKYTESVNEDAWLQILGYDTFYKRAKHLTATTVQSFLVSAKTPQAETLTEWDYAKTDYSGIYHSSDRIWGRIMLLSLNQLADEPHNAIFKCFANRRGEKQKAFTTLDNSCVTFLKDKLERLLAGLYQHWFSHTGEEFMKQSLTPEKVMEIGQQWLEAHLASLPVDERLKGLKPQKVFSRFTPQERLTGLKLQEVFSQYAPQERLAGLSVEEIEEYLNQLKRKQARRKGN